MARKIFIAIHGVGNQKQFDTVQLVAEQVIRRVTRESGPRISLGTFSSGAQTGVPTTIDAVYWHGDDPGQQIGLAEVYWADLCHLQLASGIRLEQGVPWAQTLVDRAKALKQTAAPDKPNPDYEKIRAVISEMGDGLQLLDWLSSLAPKLNLPTFDVNRIVNEYLGDVQFVAEFRDIRNGILNRFKATLDGVAQRVGLKADDEIYLVTHSEGTVIALLGLMEAMTGENGPTWLEHIRGWMTIGSPIDKHLILWPELWKQFQAGPKHVPRSPIVWWNYSDYGDPIGYEVRTARDWMREDRGQRARWNQAFKFEEPPAAKKNDQFVEIQKNLYEQLFTRYPWPGKAHIDYWHDADLFDHFLWHAAHIGKEQKQGPLPDRWMSRISSYVVPYLIAFAVLVAAMFFFDKGIRNSRGTPSDPQFATFSVEILSLSGLLAGTTVLARMPRLAREKWRFGFLATGIFAIFAALFCWCFPPDTAEYIHERLIARGLQIPAVHFPAFVVTSDDVIRFLFVVLAFFVGLNATVLRFKLGRVLMKVTMSLALLALLVLSIARLIGRRVPFVTLPDHWSQWIGLWATAVCFCVTLLWAVYKADKDHSAGLWPLIGPGFTAVVGIGSAVAMSGATIAATAAAGSAHAQAHKVEQPHLWPLLIGALAFLFLWKLAAILFDLTFVWHRYVKQNVMLIWMRENLIER